MAKQRIWLYIITFMQFTGIRSQDLLTVNISNYRFSTEDKPSWETHDQLIIPTFFKELEFECNSTFPTKWILSKNPLEDKHLQGIPEITKSRSTDATGKITFSSKILFKFKDPRSIQTFACQSAHVLYNREHPINTFIKTIVKSPTQLSLKFIHNQNTDNTKVFSEVENTKSLYGESTDCGIVIEIDFGRKAFACTLHGERKLIPRVEFCQNPDECDSIAYTGNPRCPHSVKLECLKDCNDFNPRMEPGVIICGVGVNSIAIKFTVLTIEDSNSSQLVHYNDASNAADFIHIVYTNHSAYDMQEVHFVCKASKYVFSLGFQWIMTTTTGAKYLLEDGNEKLVINDGMYILNKTVIFNMTKYGNISTLSCVGPLWNSRKSVQSDCKISMKASVRPQILERNRTVDVDTGNYTVDCTYRGEPQPQVTWTLWQRKIEMDEPFFKIVNRNGSSHFTIVNIESLIQQNRRLFRVTCRVENFLGVEERLFIIENREWTNRILIISVISLVILLLLILVGGWLYLRWIRKKNLEYVKKDIKLFLEGNPTNPTNDDNDIPALAQRKPYNVELEIPYENVEIDKGNALGSGAYGMVLRGSALLIGTSLIRTEVAIKTLKANSDPSHFKSLLMELKMMQYVGKHENIVNLLGACTQKIYQMELFILLELCNNGELGNYLKTHRQDFTLANNDNTYAWSEFRNVQTKDRRSQKDLLMWAQQIATGMNYLASKKVIHGDLAVRNVLLNDDFTAKLCDFGLSRQLYQYAQYVKKQQASSMPWKWMAIESLRDMEFSTASDVWSYGITLWEIFTLGEVPYPGQSWTNEFLQLLIEGYRLKIPTNCSDEIFKIMEDCWRNNPKERPTFLVLQNRFHKLLHR